MSLRSISRTLYQRLAAAAGADISEKTLVSSSNTRINNPNGDEEDAASHESGQDPNKDLPSERVLFEFMRLAGEAITYIEARELWRDMRSTNNGSLPRFRDMMMQSSSKSLRRLPSKSLAAETAHTLSSTNHHTTAAANLNSTLRRDDTPNGEENDTRLDQATMDTLLNLSSDVSKLSDEELSLFCTDLASEIKAAYSIRHSSDKSEFKFCVSSMMFLWAASLGTIIASFFYPSNATLGKFSPALLVESFSLFAIELVWECILSWVVLKYNIKINYTRKLGNLLKVSLAGIVWKWRL